jgi:transcriptional regulator with XRE-family HTH domain
MTPTDHDHDLLRAVGTRIREARLARRLTQDALSELIGVDPQTIQRAEAGRVSLSLPHLKALADALGVSLADVFGEAPGVPDAPWDPSEAAFVAVFRRIPADRRDLAMRVLSEFAR